MGLSVANRLTPPEGWSPTDDRQDVWRVGHLFAWATGFDPPCWLRCNTHISIRPGETGAEAAQRQFGEPLAKNEFVFWNADF